MVLLSLAYTPKDEAFFIYFLCNSLKKLADFHTIQKLLNIKLEQRIPSIGASQLYD